MFFFYLLNIIFSADDPSQLLKSENPEQFVILLTKNEPRLILDPQTLTFKENTSEKLGDFGFYRLFRTTHGPGSLGFSLFRTQKGFLSLGSDKHLDFTKSSDEYSQAEIEYLESVFVRIKFKNLCVKVGEDKKMAVDKCPGRFLADSSDGKFDFILKSVVDPQIRKLCTKINDQLDQEKTETFDSKTTTDPQKLNISKDSSTKDILNPISDSQNKIEEVQIANEPNDKISENQKNVGDIPSQDQKTEDSLGNEKQDDSQDNKFEKKNKLDSKDKKVPEDSVDDQNNKNLQDKTPVDLEIPKNKTKKNENESLAKKQDKSYDKDIDKSETDSSDQPIADKTSKTDENNKKKERDFSSNPKHQENKKKLKENQVGESSEDSSLNSIHQKPEENPKTKEQHSKKHKHKKRKHKHKKHNKKKTENKNNIYDELSSQKVYKNKMKHVPHRNSRSSSDHPIENKNTNKKRLHTNYDKESEHLEEKSSRNSEYSNHENKENDSDLIENENYPVSTNSDTQIKNEKIPRNNLHLLCTQNSHSDSKVDPDSEFASNCFDHDSKKTIFSSIQSFFNNFSSKNYSKNKIRKNK